MHNVGIGLAAWLLVATPIGTLGAESPSDLRSLYEGSWKFTCYWVNDVERLGPRPGESMGSYTGKATIAKRENHLLLSLIGDLPVGPSEKEIAVTPSPSRLSMDVRNTKRRAGVTEYIRCELVLSPDRTTLLGVANWSNGLNANRSNEENLLKAQPVAGFYPWGIGWSSLQLERDEPPPETSLNRPKPAEPRRLQLELSDPDSLAEADDLKETLADLEKWLTGLGYEVLTKPGDEKPDLRGILEVGRFQPNATGQEFYFDTANNQAVRFLKGWITMGVSFSIKDAKGKRTLLNVTIQRSRESAVSNDDPKTRMTAKGPVILSPNMAADYKQLLHLLPGQVAAQPPKQRKSESASRLEELLIKGE